MTRYSWLLFRGEVEDAIDELMRWLTPTPATDVPVARQQLVQNYRTPKHLRLLMANIAADVLVPDLLEAQPRLAALRGLRRAGRSTATGLGADEWQVEVRGIDVYDPASGEVHSDDPERDRGLVPRPGLRPQELPGRPGVTSLARARPTPWERLSRALKGWVDPDAFEMLQGRGVRSRSGPAPSGGRP